MKIPSEIIIKGKAWKVKYRWGLRSGPDIVNGEMDPNTRTIYLRRELSKEEKLPVFLHEFMHAVFFEAHLSYNDGWVDGLIEEVMCDAIATSFLESFNIRPK